MSTPAGVSSLDLNAGRSVRYRRFAVSLRRVHHVLRDWHQRVRSRRELALLDSRALRDIGITHADRLAELRKPFWRP
jgi:uncharacterized protein YjiS (DUF1127 family)